MRVITRGKPVYISRPVKKLFPLEVNARSLQGARAEERASENTRRDTMIPRQGAALDAAWKTREMLLDTEHD